MTTTEHLERIKQKCVELVAKYPLCESTAGWRSNIAAIEFIYECEDDGYKTDSLSQDIIAAWPEELL